MAAAAAQSLGGGTPVEGSRSFPAARISKPADPPPLSLFPVRQMWKLSLNSALTEQPAYDGSRVYLPIEGDRIVAYELTSGTQQWIVSAHSESALVAGDGLLFLVEADALAALHVTDGSLAWRLPFPNKLAVPLVWDNGWLIVATQGGTVFALRATDGQLIWRHAIGAAAHARPALAADRVYIPVDDGRVVALRVDTGQPVWERQLGGAPGDVLALDARLYVGSAKRYFYCLKTEDGADDWRWRIGATVVGVPVVDEHSVYFVSLDNLMRALDRNSGNQRWRAALPLRPATGPVQADGTLIVAGFSPSLSAYAVRDGKPAGEVPTGAEVAAPPYVFTDPTTQLPIVIALSSDIAQGATITAVTRAIEPAILPAGPLPNALTVATTALVPLP